MELRREWQRKLHAAGYLGMGWPVEWGGRGAGEVEESIFDEETARADAPQVLNLLGISLLGPALIHHGTEEQRRRFIPPMLAADEIWCQGFSEPGAGSDLAALRTSARIDGDSFVLNGQKIWTTFGPWADWIFVLARTDAADRYGGISFILCKLDTPGVTVRPLRQITGESEFGEVFFEDARVPRENLLGEIGEGWRIAMTVLAFERGASSLSFAARFSRDLAQLAATCRELGRGGSAVREKLARLLVENEVLRANGIRMLANLADGKVPGPEASIEKIFWSEFDRRFRETAIDLLGPGAQLAAPEPCGAQRGRLGARVPLVARRDDLLWIFRDSAKHHLQAGSQAAAGVTMKFELSEDQALLRNSTRDFLASEWPLERSRRLLEHDERGYDPSEWARLAEMGYLGLTLPVEAGGQGLGAIELAIVLEEIGRACMPGPYLDAVLAASLLHGSGSNPELLAEVIAGKKLLTIARDESAFAGAAPEPTRVAGGRVRGRKHYVPFAAYADALLVTTPTEVCLVRGPFEVTPEPTIDLAARFGAVSLDHPATVVGPATLLEPVERLGSLGAAALLLGIMSRCLEMTLEYVQTRQAFRKPIGAFQALQHRLADMLLKTESSRSAVYRAAWCHDTGDPRGAAHRGHRQGLRRRRRPPRLWRIDPDARRHRLHLGARPAPLLQARQEPRAALRLDGEAAGEGSGRRRAEIHGSPAAAKGQQEHSQQGRRPAVGGGRNHGAAAPARRGLGRLGRRRRSGVSAGARRHAGGAGRRGRRARLRLDRAERRTRRRAR